MTNYVVDLKTIEDPRGNLTVLENLKNVPFEIKRIYYLNNISQGSARGFHAHKKLRQMAICLSGSCRFIMDDGLKKEDFILSKFNQAIMIDPLVWHEMHDFSPNCVLLVLADDFYDESDYLRDYESFKNALK